MSVVSMLCGILTVSACSCLSVSVSVSVSVCVLYAQNSDHDGFLGCKVSRSHRGYYANADRAQGRGQQGSKGAAS